MDIALMVLGVASFPVAGLALLLWLTHLEETLPRDVRSAQRTSPPPPVLAVPVQQQPAVPVVRQMSASAPPEWSRKARPAEAAEVRTADQAFSRSTRLSLGGSTKR